MGPTPNRPFGFANFFAAFRAHSALQKSPAPIKSTPTSISASSITATARYHATASAEATSQPSTALTKDLPLHAQSVHIPSPYSTTAVTSAPQSHFRTSRPLHPPTGTPHNTTARARSTSRDAPVYGPHLPPTTPSFGGSRTPSSTRPNPGAAPATAPTHIPRQRRGSDSSEGSGKGMGNGFLGAGPAEKWYIGGKTAHGEERFYKLSLISRSNSADRLSLDRLSL